VRIFAGSLDKLPLWCIVQSSGDKAQLTTHGPIPIQYCASAGSLPLIQRLVAPVACASCGYCAVSLRTNRWTSILFTVT
jgi:hypothetical protein